MEQQVSRIKDFFQSMGFAAALMAGFSFSAIIEIQSWQPVFFNTLPMKSFLYIFLVISFISFVMPIMLNMLFLNMTVRYQSQLDILRKAQMLYIVTVGMGIGCLQGALCLFLLGTLSSVFAYLLIVLILLALLVTYAVMKFFKSKMAKAEAKEQSTE